VYLCCFFRPVCVMVWAPVRKQRFKHLALRWGFYEQCAEQTVQARPIELRFEREQLPGRSMSAGPTGIPFTRRAVRKSPSSGRWRERL